MTRTPRYPRAFMMIDALIGLMIVGMLALLLTTAIGKKYRAQQRLADLRDANRVAERVLLNLQAHQAVPTLPQAQIKMRAVDGAAPAGFVWTSVEVRIRGSGATLYGIVPAAGGAP